MNTEKYIIHLSDEERQELETVIKKLKGTSQKVNRAMALLHADANGPDWTNEQIAARTGLTVRAIINIRKQLVMHDFADAEKSDHCFGQLERSHEGIILYAI